jgi:hypothetical protein
MIAGQEKFQSVSILPEQQPHFQSGTTLKNIFSQSSNGNSAVQMWMAETIRNYLQRSFDAREIGIAKIF